ncbi:DUF2125 domain-containing protein [Pseudoponticoccus marisrubri]|uniref:DUF2125 domain-containing protein n=1 Tax=Pseudoponticoccus marisrubri TaxID=1685382 RepID=A0A0W7WKJ5_9RHOB|nr:DUF2125 domain-containing protein [Pseudoponticoccus marisrubri]KUF11055.1 hypothetical protein AVJ23_08335 [Pseudoponticoccus marisrubri]
MSRFATVSALALCALASPSLADVTPQQVWDDLETYLEGFGYAVTGTESMAGDTLTVSDVVMSIEMPEADGTVEITMAQVTLTDRGDGTVSMTFPEVMPIAIAFDAEEGEDGGEMVLEYGQQNFEMVISGEAGALTYDYSADALTFTLASLTENGEEIGRDALSIDVATGPVVGRSNVTRTAGMQAVAQELQLGDMAYDFTFNDPDSGDSGRFSGTFTGLYSTGETVAPTDADFSDPAALFTSGLGVDVVIGHAGGQTDFEVTEEAGTTTGTLSSDSGELGIAVSEASLTYALSSTAQTMALSGPEIPFPVQFGLEDTGFSLSMPLQPGDGPQPAALSIVMGGFTMSDMLWGIFDPAGNLPRDPATVALDLEALVTPFVNIFDPEQMEALEDSSEPPAEINALTVNELVVDAVGGVIQGSGAVTFDNSDLETYDGMPRPDGSITFEVAGANALVDKLIAMGMMTEEDAMGMRMMMSMFTVPGDEPDTASSVIEFTPEGQILANGQRIK